MDEPILHSTTKLQLEKFLSRPSHAVIISGPEGIGKHTISIWLGKQLLGLQDSIENYPYISIVQPDGQSISIQAMRDLANFTKLKIPKSKRSISRLVIIEQAQLLTTEAQNALLKLLEEPPEGTVLILTAPNDQSLLSTIRSRAQKIHLQMPSSNQLASFFESKDYEASKINQALLMSGGLPGLMQALLGQSDEHPLIKASQTARLILKSDAFTRQCLIDSLAKQRVELGRLLFMIKQMAHAAIAQNAVRGSDASIIRWQKIQTAAYTAETELTVNAQPKLVLSNFMLQI
ncbi:MAG TPA: hypothetical protein VLG47_07085 [Candidatus Saccharimonadales bacterium]|nr:hypothetical protein [Candidatus Saccharimonadales bacterium]